MFYLVEFKLRPFDEIVELIPPMSDWEFEELKQSMETSGQIESIKVVQDGRIIDGLHRWKILGDKVKYDILNVSDKEAIGLAVKLNVHRRQLSIEQKREIFHKMAQLDTEWLKDSSQEEIGHWFGVSQRTISNWNKGDFSKFANTHQIPDKRYDLTRTDEKEIVKQLALGKSQRQVASDYGVNQSTISDVKAREEDRVEVVNGLNKDDLVLLEDQYKDLDKLELQKLQRIIEKGKEIEAVIATPTVTDEERTKLMAVYGARRFDPKITLEEVQEAIQKTYGVSVITKKQKELNELIERIADKYGGTVDEWDDDKTKYRSLTLTYNIDYGSTIDFQIFLMQGTIAKGNIIPSLVRVDKPYSEFGNMESALRYAKEHGGYCSGEISVNGKKFWCMFLKEEKSKEAEDVVQAKLD